MGLLLVSCSSGEPAAPAGPSEAAEPSTAAEPATGEPAADADSGGQEPAESGSGGGYRIGVSNNIVGNSWRAQFIEGIELAAEELKAAGMIEELQLVSCDSDLTTQLNQINSMIADGYDAIMINAVSDTALSEVIKKAVDAGIQVYLFNDPAAYEDTICIAGNTDMIWKPVVQWFAEQYPEEGGTYVYISGIPASRQTTKGRRS